MCFATDTLDYSSVLTHISPYFWEYQPQVPRSMGCNPSNEELQEMIAEMDEDNSGTVDFEVEYLGWTLMK